MILKNGIEICSTCGIKNGYHSLHCRDKPKPSAPPAPAPYVNDDYFVVFNVANKEHLAEVWQMLPAAYNGKKWRTA